MCASVLGQRGQGLAPESVEAETGIVEAQRFRCRPQEVLIDGAVIPADSPGLLVLEMRADAENEILVMSVAWIHARQI
jgi:hypothetical protein